MTHDLLIGSTGFVGHNLAEKHTFAKAVHSTDIKEAFDEVYDRTIYAGVTGTKFLANLSPADDRRVIDQAIENLSRIRTHQLVLISTIDVYGENRGLHEDDAPLTEALDTYGRHRLQLEQWVRKQYPDALIVRLPAIYGSGLKKNFVYDLIHRAPAFLSPEKFNELRGSHPLITRNYLPGPSGLWRNERIEQADELDIWFESQAFNALCFTDSRSVFQFYDLGRLWNHIEFALEKSFRILNIAPPPLRAQSVYEAIYGRTWINKLCRDPLNYDMRSKLLIDAAPDACYLETPEKELEQLKRFVLKEQQKNRI